MSLPYLPSPEYRENLGITVIELMVVIGIILIVSTIIAVGLYAFYKSHYRTAAESGLLCELRTLQMEFGNNLRSAKRSSIKVYNTTALSAIYFQVQNRLYGYKFDRENHLLFKTVDSGDNWFRLPNLKHLKDLGFKATSAGDMVKVDVELEGEEREKLATTFLFSPRVEERSTVWLDWKYMRKVSISTGNPIKLKVIKYFRIRSRQRVLVNQPVKLTVRMDKLPPNLAFLRYKHGGNYLPSDFLPYWIERSYTTGGERYWDIWVLHPKLSGGILMVSLPEPDMIPNYNSRGRVLSIIGQAGYERLRRNLSIPLTLEYHPTSALNVFASIQDYRNSSPSAPRFEAYDPFKWTLTVERYRNLSNQGYTVGWLALKPGLWTLGEAFIENDSLWTTSREHKFYFWKRMRDVKPPQFHQLVSRYERDYAHSRIEVDNRAPYTYTYLKVEEPSSGHHRPERVAFMYIVGYDGAKFTDEVISGWESGNFKLQAGNFSFTNDICHYSLPCWHPVRRYYQPFPETPTIISKVIYSYINRDAPVEERLRDISSRTYYYSDEHSLGFDSARRDDVSWLAFTPRVTDPVRDSLIFGAKNWVGIDYTLYEDSPPSSVNLYTDLLERAVSITLDTRSLISQGKLRADCADLRVLDTNLSTPLPFWIEEGTCNTTSTRIWVRVPFIRYNSTKTIYIVYGNESVDTSPSDLNRVFDKEHIRTAEGIWDTDLLIEYHFDEGNGDIARDESGNGLDLNLSGEYKWAPEDGGTWAYRNARFSYGSYLVFSRHGKGILRAVYLPKLGLTWTKAFSLKNALAIELWLYYISDGNLVRLTDDRFKLVWQVMVKRAQPILLIQNSDLHIFELPAKMKLKPGLWYHIVATFDGKLARIYINGKLTNQIEVKGNILWGSDEQYLEVGASDNAVDELRIYTRALTPKEVTDHFFRLRAIICDKLEPVIRLYSETSGPSFYRRVPIKITNSSGRVLFDQQVKLVVDTAYLVSKGYVSVDIYHNIKGLVFTDSDGVTTLPYWVKPGTESTDRTVIWVRVPELPVGDKVIYMYYDQDRGTQKVGRDIYNTFDQIGIAMRDYLDGTWRDISVPSIMRTHETDLGLSDKKPVYFLFTVTRNEYYNTCSKVYPRDIIVQCSQAVARISATSKAGLTAKIEEYYHDNQYHAGEVVNWIAMLPGIWQLADDTVIDVQRVKVNGYDSDPRRWVVVMPRVPLKDSLIIAKIQSYNEVNYNSLGAHVRALPDRLGYRLTIEEEGSVLDDPDYVHDYEDVGVVFSEKVELPVKLTSHSHSSYLAFMVGYVDSVTNFRWTYVRLPRFFRRPSISATIISQNTREPNNAYPRFYSVYTTGFRVTLERTPIVPNELRGETLAWMGLIVSSKESDWGLYGIKYVPRGDLSVCELDETYLTSTEETRP